MSCDGGGGEPPAEDIAVMVQGVTLEYMERVASGDQIMAAVGSWLFLIGTAPEYIYLLSINISKTSFTTLVFRIE